MQASADEQPVERQLDVEGANALRHERDGEVLLERRPGPEPEVVVGPEEPRLAELRQLRDERSRRAEQKLVVAAPVRSEPRAVVVVLELAQEVERLGRPHGSAS